MGVLVDAAIGRRDAHEVQQFDRAPARVGAPEAEMPPEHLTDLVPDPERRVE